EYSFDERSIDTEIARFESEIQISQMTINDLVEQVQSTQKWVTHFKNFINYLNDITLKGISEYTNIFLEKINCSMRVLLSNTTEVKSGETRPKISVNITKQDGSVSRYGRFSEGEKCRISICNILACQALLNNSLPYSKGIDIIIIDEIIESLDANGVDQLLRVLNSIGKTIIIITHANHNSNFENITTIKKQNNISYVVQ
ncbi:MAG: hypothetical protein JHC54_15355, partial [Acinetobacter sp.]|nr:hypothetical protein [Acinetobacter sp.]